MNNHTTPAQPTPARLLTAVLATQRLTRLVTTDTITEPAREWVFATFGDPSTKHTAREKISPSYLASCPHCASVYIATLIAILVTLPLPPTPRRIVDTALLALALSGAISAAHDAADALPTPGGWSS
jgi:hypothetical protein